VWLWRRVTALRSFLSDVGIGMKAPDTSATAAKCKWVAVIDTDDGVRLGLHALFAVHGFDVRTYPTAEAFLSKADTHSIGCIITEVQLAGMSGTDLQRQLRRVGCSAPVIVLATEPTVGTAVRAMRLGAIDFLEKPFFQRVLLTRVRQALHHCRPS